MEKINITVAGVPYTIATDNDTEYTLRLVEEINERIQTIMETGRFIAPAQAVTLALLEYADEAKKAASEAAAMKVQLKEYLTDAAQAKSERDVLRRELAKIKKGGQS